MNGRTQDRFYAAVDANGEIRLHQFCGNRAEVAGALRTLGQRLVLGPAPTIESIQRQAQAYRARQPEMAGAK